VGRINTIPLQIADFAQAAEFVHLTGLKPGVVRTSPSARSNQAVGTSAPYAEALGHAPVEAASLCAAPIANKPAADAAARSSGALLLMPAV
jgi:hypothetical protein